LRVVFQLSVFYANKRSTQGWTSDRLTDRNARPRETGSFGVGR